MIKKTASIIGLVMLTFCFGLSIAGLIASDVNAIEGPPIPSCDLGYCVEFITDGCPPGEFKMIVYERRRRFNECCGIAGPLIPCRVY